MFDNSKKETMIVLVFTTLWYFMIPVFVNVDGFLRGTFALVAGLLTYFLVGDRFLARLLK